MDRFRTAAKRLCLAACLLGLSAALSACDTAGGLLHRTASAASAEVEPIEISLLVPFASSREPSLDNPLLRQIERRTNTRLTIQWVPADSYAEWLKLSMAANRLADLTVVSAGNPQVVQMAEAGRLWEVTPFVKDYPHLAALPPTVWANGAIGGRVYGIPRMQVPANLDSMPMVRKDWLDALGLSIPLTMEQLLDAARAFTKRDPDGNGQADTIGLTGHLGGEPGYSLGSLLWVEQAFTGTVGKWKLTNGKLTPVVLEPGIRQALEWLRQAYTEKLLSQDIGVRTGAQARESFANGQAGIIGSALNAQWRFTETLRHTVPSADVYPLPYVSGPEGIFAPRVGYGSEMVIIPKRVPYSNVLRMLAFLDFGLSEQGANLANGAGLGQLFGRYDKYGQAFSTDIPQELYERNKRIVDLREEIGRSDAAAGLHSRTALAYESELNKRIQDMKLNIMVGRLPLQAWDEFVDRLKADPLLIRMTEEMNDAYNAGRQG